MNIDFAFWLTLAVFISGIIWLIDFCFFESKRRALAEQQAKQQKKDAVVVKDPLILEYAKSFFPVLLIVLVLRSFLVEPYQIPSGSMIPTLLVGDFILVNKFAYGIRLPVINTKIIGMGEPKRGDVMVFRYPRDPKINYIKRVIGVGGDVVRYEDKVYYINGKPMQQRVEGVYEESGFGELVVTEHLDGVTHKILKRNDYDRQAREWHVPQGYYFMSGDNRDNSNDSRIWGLVPEKNIVGEAFAIWFHKDPGWALPTLDRNGLIY